MKLNITHIEMEAEPGECSEVIRAALFPGSPAAAEALPAAIIHSPAALPPPQETAEPKEPKRRGPGAKKPHKKVATPAVAAAPALRAAPGGGDSVATRVLDALRKKPMSSIELSQALKLEPQQIYGAVHLLHKRGFTESRNDDTDGGTRRWFVIAGK